MMTRKLSWCVWCAYFVNLSVIVWPASSCAWNVWNRLWLKKLHEAEEGRGDPDKQGMLSDSLTHQSTHIVKHTITQPQSHRYLENTFTPVIVPYISYFVLSISFTHFLLKEQSFPLATMLFSVCVQSNLLSPCHWLLFHTQDYSCSCPKLGWNFSDPWMLDSLSEYLWWEEKVKISQPRLSRWNS